jgi:DNA helicase-2/ATP-dependent DNA helicase PcrA
MDWDDGIEGPHLAIAGSDARRIGVLAGPGTGKTSFGLMRRVVRLLSEGVPGSRILLLSFTRVAAADLRDKVAALEVSGVENITARTLHSYCFGLLQGEAVLELTHRVPRILLKHEVDLMLRDLGSDLGDIRARRERLEAYQAGWARGDTDYPGGATDSQDSRFERATMQWLQDHRAMLIGEVVPLAYKYLRDNPSAAERGAFDHVIVDEYQDLNRLEQELLDLLAENGSLCVAGDDDQSIYSMRYANPTGILNFIDRDETEAHAITVCGRCPQQILTMANSLISHAQGRDKAPTTCLDDSAPADVAIVQWDGLDAEVEGLVAAISSDIARGRRAPGDILVLTNWRQIGERVRQRLVELGVPAQSFFSEEELGNDAAREAIALLRLVVDGTDLVAYRVLLGLGDASGRSVAYARLRSAAAEHSSTVLDLLRRLDAGERFTGLNVPALVSRYHSAVARLDRLRGLSLEALIDELLPEADSDLTDLRAVCLGAALEADSAAGLLRKVVETITQDEVPQSPDFVRVMSLHKSKGLTSPAAFVAGAVRGILPSVSADASAEEVHARTEEGRRLFYVAATRASNQLVISSSSSMLVSDAMARGVATARVRMVAGKLTATTIASPYIAELGPAAPRPIRGVDWLNGY